MNHFPYEYMPVFVSVYDMQTGVLIVKYETDLADTAMRRTFAEQMASAYAANQYSVVQPRRARRAA